jgi:peptide chain release factor 2
LRHRVDRLTNLSSAENFWDDPERAQKILRDRTEALESLAGFERLRDEISTLREFLEMAAEEGDEQVLKEVAEQVAPIEETLRRLELKRMLSGPVDKSDAIVQIHPGAGGVDAMDWAEMLLRMYVRWCEERGFEVEMVDHQAGSEAGIKDASFIVRGAYAYGYLRAESGVHRLVRISPFDSNARRHTAFASVAVVPDLDDDVGEIEIRPEDLEVQTMRAGGAGGQHVNKTESAVRVKHVPSGIVVKCQAERSQHQNKATAIKILRGLLYERARLEREAAFEETYGGDNANIDFGSQIRSYVLHPYQMVKDLRTEHQNSNADDVLNGSIDGFIEAYLLMHADRQDGDERGVD